MRMNSEFDPQENAEGHQMVERGAALYWYDEVGDEYRAAVVLNIVLEMAEMAPVFPCDEDTVFYDDDYDAVSGKYNVLLRHCPKPFTKSCEESYKHSCYANASDDARMMLPIDYIASFAIRPEWDPVHDDDIEEILTLKRKEQREQQKMYTLQEPDSVGSFLQNMRARINAKAEQGAQVSSQNPNGDDSEDDDQEDGYRSLMDIAAELESGSQSQAEPGAYARSEGMQALYRSITDKESKGQGYSGSGGPGFC